MAVQQGKEPTRTAYTRYMATTSKKRSPASRHRLPVLIALTTLMCAGLASFVHKEDGVDPWQLTLFCIVVATVLLTMPKEHGRVFPAVGFKLILTSILIIVGYGIFDAQFTHILTAERWMGEVAEVAGVMVILASFILLSWSMAELALESAKKLRE